MRMDLLKGIEEQENAIENSKTYQEEEAFLNLMRQGKSCKEAYEAIGREKTWASRTIKKIRETQPERLKGTVEEIEDKAHVDHLEQDMTINDAPQPIHKSEVTSESQEPVKILTEQKTQEKANIKPQKQSFSFRADLNKIEAWKLYAEAIGAKDIGTLWSAAIDEYISNHKLTEDQQVIYNLKKKIAEMQKNQK